MKLRLYILAILAAVGTTPALAQRTHPGGGPPCRCGCFWFSRLRNNWGRWKLCICQPHGHDALLRRMMSSPTTLPSLAKLKRSPAKMPPSACNGFKNLGQCVAAAHVAKNLDIPGGFDALKAKTTGTGAVSLGKAIELCWLSPMPTPNPKPRELTNKPSRT